MVAALRSSKRKSATANSSEVARSSKKLKADSTTTKPKVTNDELAVVKVVEPKVNDAEANDVTAVESMALDMDSSSEDEEEINDKDTDLVINTDSLPLPVKKQNHSTNDKPGVVYLGRIPHGFYEQEMRAYFTQFGHITRLRLSRNKVTGKSKHYAFIEFSSHEVADIVAETMNNYLLYGHILKCRVVPESEWQDKMWVGANRKWKVPPLAKIRRVKNDRKKPIEKWQSLQEKEQKRRLKSNERWQAAGIEYSFDPPTLTGNVEKKAITA